MHITGRERFQKYKVAIRCLVHIMQVFPLKMRKRILVMLQNKKGVSGIALRYILLKGIAIKCGENVLIKENVYLYSPENLSIGNNVSIHPMCYIDPGKATIKIGDNVSIAHGTTIIAESHTFKDRETPIKYQPMKYEDIEIEDDVWIGAKCTILMGTTLHTGCVVGANSVVTHNVEKDSIVAGSPAKKIKDRTEGKDERTYDSNAYL